MQFLEAIAEPPRSPSFCPTRLAWVINPDEESVLVYRKPKPSRLLQLEDSLDGEEFVLGFTLPLSELFQELKF